MVELRENNVESVYLLHIQYGNNNTNPDNVPVIPIYVPILIQMFQIII